MIIFIDNPELIQMIQGYFNKPINIYNLSSLYSGYIDCTDLLTNIATINTTMPLPDFVQSVDFDIQYAAMVMNNQVLFVKLMMILSNSYEGNISIVLVEHDFYRDAIMESIIKFIQQRYGYNCWVIENPDDIIYIKEPHYTPMGLLNLDSDLQKYDSLFVDQINE